MASGATKNYKFGQKNHWRRTVWNEVLHRTNGKEQKQPILYLAGPQDLDRTIAIDKGVPAQNLIAIDLSEQNIKRVRQGKVPGVVGDMADVLRAWPEDRPVAAVMLDFCSGFTADAADVFDLFQLRPFRNSICMINLMRGRDSWSNPVRAWMIEFDLLWRAVASWEFGLEGPPGLGGDCDKHRALQFLLYHTVDYYGAASDGVESGEIARLGADVQASLEFMTDERMALPAMGMFFGSMRPRFYSYRSGVLTFDSAVFESPYRYLDMASGEHQVLADASLDKVLVPKRQSMTRRLAAMFAVRTVRAGGMIGS